MSLKRMKCFRLFFDHIAWIEHQFLRVIRDSRKTRSMWGMMRGVGGVRKSIHQGWLAKKWGLGLLFWCFKWVQGEIPSEEARLFDQDGHQPPYSRDLSPCDFWLFPKLRGCRYEIIEEMKEAVTKVIDTLTQEDFHGAFQKLLERYKYISAGVDYFVGD